MLEWLRVFPGSLQKNSQAAWDLTEARDNSSQTILGVTILFCSINQYGSRPFHTSCLQDRKMVPSIVKLLVQTNSKCVGVWKKCRVPGQP